MTGLNVWFIVKSRPVHGELNKANIYDYHYDNRYKISLKYKEKYAKNSDKIKQRVKNYRINNLEKVRAAEKVSKEKRKDKIRIQKRKYREQNAEHIKQVQKNRRDDLKLAAMIFYSNGTLRCAICGDSKYEHLCLDHINGDGSKHRVENKSVVGQSVYAWVKKHDYPPIFRVLCYNCNILIARKTPKSPERAERRLKIKIKALSAYSDGILQCKECGIDDIRILTIDHMNGGGHKHMQQLGMKGGESFYTWLKKNNYPSGFQVLCFNYNCSKNCKS